MAQKWAKVSVIREARAAKRAKRVAKRESRRVAVVIPFRFEERITQGTRYEQRH
jgi:hypothetical protein